MMNPLCQLYPSPVFYESWLEIRGETMITLLLADGGYAPLNPPEWIER